MRRGRQPGQVYSEAMRTGHRIPNRLLALGLVGAAAIIASPAAAQIDLGGLAKKAAKAAASTGRDEVVKKVNAKLMADGRKNQCSFKTDSDELEPGCDGKLKKLTNALVDAKKRLDSASVTELQVRGLRPHRLQRQGRPQQGAVAEARRRDRQGAGRARHPAERDHLARHRLGAPAGDARRHAGQEGQEPPLRDPGPVTQSPGV